MGTHVHTVVGCCRGMHRGGHVSWNAVVGSVVENMSWVYVVGNIVGYMLQNGIVDDVRGYFGEGMVSWKGVVDNTCRGMLSWGTSWVTWVQVSVSWTTYVVEVCRGMCRGQHGYKSGCRGQRMSWKGVVGCVVDDMGTS